MDVTSGRDVRNNLIYNTGNGVCIHWPKGATTFDATTYSDYNVLYSDKGLPMVAFSDNGNGHFFSITDWQKDFGLDTHSIISNPLLVNPAILNGNYNLQATSPLLVLELTLFNISQLMPMAMLVPPPVIGTSGAYQYSSVPINNNPPAPITQTPASDTTPPSLHLHHGLKHHHKQCRHSLDDK